VKKQKKAYLSKSSVTYSLPIFVDFFAPECTAFTSSNNSVSISFVTYFMEFL